MPKITTLIVLNLKTMGIKIKCLERAINCTQDSAIMS